jgi:hypothetical protein
MNDRRALIAALATSIVFQGPGLVLAQGQPGGAVAPSAPSPTNAPASTGEVLKAERLAKGEFKALPDSAVIEVYGQQTTAGAIRAKRREAQPSLDVLRAQAKNAWKKSEATRAAFFDKQQVDLDARNAEVQAHAARLRLAESARVAARMAVDQEAQQLVLKLQTASPAEREQIQRRARELLRQLQEVLR